MALILTFLGKGGTGRTTTAIAVAKKLARLGSRVLIAGHDASLGWELGVNLGPTVTELETNLSGIQFLSTVLLEKGWEQIKELESQYLRSPTLKNIYGQELGVLPGMDEILTLNALREYSQSGKYDVLVYDGTGNLAALRMLGVPEIADWYWRRFKQVLQDSDVVKTVTPFLQPIAATVLNVSWNFDNLSENPQSPEKLLAEGREFLSNPDRFAAYLVTTANPSSVLIAKNLWGGAQQVGLTVKGVFHTELDNLTLTSQEFSPLAITTIPKRSGQDWEALIHAIPDVRQALDVPKPLIVDIPARQVKVFLPGFDKKQVKLTQYGPEITIEAGDQRRNIALPSPLNGQPVTGAKFQEGYLIISF
ncbi:MAG: Get3/ArsA fold putative tail anchor-mediating ATPase NosAFP [Microcystaceae cyanobacterium]